MKNIQKIEIKRPLINKRKKVAAYARVSMDTDRLKHSLSAQVSYYSNFIQSNPEWDFKGVYSDYAISGTKIDGRESFIEMLEECEKGNIDIILTKSIKRFARNTVDLLKVVRHLKSKGIEVRFENENISSLSGEGELMLSILASFAEEESRSISQNVKWSNIKRFQKGIPVSKPKMLGYVWKGNTLEIVEEEAKIVRRIYLEYLSGKSRLQISKILAKENAKTVLGGKWGDSNIKAILKNITYTGNMLFQKEYVLDPISKKSRINRGELPQYYVENTHEAIIPKEEYDRVQEEMERRKLGGVFTNPAINTSELTSKIRCTHCNKNFRKVTDKNRVSWKCAVKRDGSKNDCPTCSIKDKRIKEMICEVLNLKEYDPSIFLQEIAHIDVIGRDRCIFFKKNGEEVEKWI